MDVRPFLNLMVEKKRLIYSSLPVFHPAPKLMVSYVSYPKIN